jgi:hypothetical protein
MRHMYEETLRKHGELEPGVANMVDVLHSFHAEAGRRRDRSAWDAPLTHAITPSNLLVSAPVFCFYQSL